jgi:hypothetical protein
MDAVLLDTDVFSYLTRTHDTRGDAYRPHVAGKTVAISFITVGEILLWRGEKKWGKQTLNLPFCSRLLCEIGRLDLPPCDMANGKHPHRLPPFFYFIDNPINVRLLTVKQMPQFSL